MEGCLLYVFNINGFITHLAAWRNGTPDEMAEQFIGGRAAPGPRRGGADGGGGGDEGGGGGDEGGGGGDESGRGSSGSGGSSKQRGGGGRSGGGSGSGIQLLSVLVEAVGRLWLP